MLSRQTPICIFILHFRLSDPAAAHNPMRVPCRRMHLRGGAGANSTVLNRSTARGYRYFDFDTDDGRFFLLA